MTKVLFGLFAGEALLAGTAVPSFAGWQQGGWNGGWHGGWRAPVVFVGPRFVAPPVFVHPRPFVFAAPVVVAAPPVVVAAPPLVVGPPVVLAPPPVAPAPPVFLQQNSQFWYYCQNPAGEYPSVPECASGWMQVVPQSQ